MDEKEFQDLMRYQNMLMRQAMQEARTDKKIKLLGLIDKLTWYGKRKVQTAAIVHEAETNGFSESEAYDILDELGKDRIVEQKSSYIIKL